MGIIFYIKYYKKIIKSFLVSDKKFFEKTYYKKFKKRINLLNPKTFNEKIIYRILYDRRQVYTELADKYKVREYIKNRIGENYLIKLYGVFEDTEQISLKNLPTEFVIKCTHDSGSAIICKNVSIEEFEKVKKKIKKSLKKNFYYNSREWHYKNIKPRIICEEKLEDITDYKLHCFYGKVELIEVIYNRFEDKRENLYDKNWEFKDIKISGCKNTEKKLEKPKNFEKMIEISEILSKDFDYVRIDLYNNNGIIKFGEFTFTPASGFDDLPDDLNLYLGKLWEKSQI